MPKLKTKKGVAKRFKLTKRGKIKYSPGGKGHLASCKETKHLRRLRRRDTLTQAKRVKFIKKMLPYR
ncbi:MAG: 50S ribosomal protein L35 [Candidatus Omnitrophota bacterium]